MDPRIQIIRQVMACILACVLWSYDCQLPWLPLALVMPPLFSLSSTCTFCTPGLDPGLDMQVIVSGMADDWCTGCGTLDGTYVLLVGSIDATACVYNYQITPTPLTCSGFSQTVVNLVLQFNSSSNLIFEMRNMCNDPNGNTTWQNHYGSAVDCSAWVNESVAYSSRTKCDGPFGSKFPCVGSGATVLVTPV